MLRASFRAAKLCPTRRCCSKILAYTHHSTFYATAASLKGKAKVADGPIADFAEHLEAQGARILRVVRGKVQERARLLREAVCTQVVLSIVVPTEKHCLQEIDSASGTSTNAHIQRARAIKDLEPLSKQWEDWQSALQVCTIKDFCFYVDRTSQTHSIQ